MDMPRPTRHSSWLVLIVHPSCPVNLSIYFNKLFYKVLKYKTSNTPNIQRTKQKHTATLNNFSLLDKFSLQLRYSMTSGQGQSVQTHTLFNDLLNTTSFMYLSLIALKLLGFP